MNLKEKAFKEFVEKSDENKIFKAEDFYLAGFEKAREMAAKICSDKRFQSSHVTLTSHPAQNGCIVYTGYEIEKLGEEEVE